VLTQLLEGREQPRSSGRISIVKQGRTHAADRDTPEGREPFGYDSTAGDERPVVQFMKQDPGPPRVLVVDDQKDVRDSIVAILRAEGYVVLRAADGIEALERLRGREIDVMLLDLGLPRMDGPSLLALLDQPPAVVVCSAFGKWDETEVRQRFGSIVVECLQKPVSPIRLIAATAAAAQNRVRAS